MKKNVPAEGGISINKFVSDTGYCSRREADNLLAQGRVLLNGAPAVSGNRVQPGDEVEVDGSIITAPKKEKSIYIALYKPAGITTTTDTSIPGNIISFVNHPKRIFPIGRLDKDSEGLILLTNDGDIVNKILRAGNRHEKEYIVKINKPAEQGFVSKMSSGVHILDTVTKPCKVRMTGRQTFHITLVQGLNRQIRRMCEALGYSVMSLTRMRIMNIDLGHLAPGKWRNLSEAEVAGLKAMLGSSVNAASPADKTKPKRVPPKAKPAATSAKPEKSKTEKPAKTAQTATTPAKRSGSFKDFRRRGKNR